MTRWITALCVVVLAGCGGGSPATSDTTGSAATANIWVVPGGPGSCTRAKAPRPFDQAAACGLDAAIQAAANGDLLLFKSGDYGVWTGTTKTGLTLRAQPGERPKMTLNVRGDCCGGVVIDGFTGMAGSAGIDSAPLSGGLTIRNSTFASWLVVNRAANAADPVTLDHNRHVDIDSDGETQPAGRVVIQGSGDGVTIENSLFAGGSSDMVHLNASHVKVLGNRFIDIKDGLHGSKNHADPIQVYCDSPDPNADGCGAEVIDRNYFDQSGGNGANAVAYIGMYDSTFGNRITNNVFRAVAGGEDGGHGVAYILELGSDRDSIIANNTAEPGTCDFGIQCGWIALGHKDGNDPGTGTRIHDNIIGGVSGLEGTQTADHNLIADPLPGNVSGVPALRGPLTSYAGFCLRSGSPGRGVGTGGTDAGIRC